jgi:stage III sporulation protein AD
VSGEWTALLAVPVIAAFAALALRRHQPEWAAVIGLLAGVGLLAAVLSKAAPVMESIGGLMDAAGLPQEYAGRIFKALGVCLLTQTAADACRDAGEGGLASKTELVGKVALLIVTLPLFERVAQSAAALIGGGA